MVDCSALAEPRDSVNHADKQLGVLSDFRSSNFQFNRFPLYFLKPNSARKFFPFFFRKFLRPPPPRGPRPGCGRAPAAAAAAAKIIEKKSFVRKKHRRKNFGRKKFCRKIFRRDENGGREGRGALLLVLKKKIEPFGRTAALCGRSAKLFDLFFFPPDDC